MIRFIEASETLPLRSQVLRDGKPISECSFPGDEERGSFHLGYFIDDELVCVATFHARGHREFPGTGFQLRGMATTPSRQKTGVGNQLLNFAIVYLRGQQANYLWCNARKAAYKFYLNLGFEFISEEFEVPGIGPHREMYLKIR
ncbi:MAG TPA: GNAT family N-acetyltransferase [Sphingobacteriaceae bacterium]